MFNEILIRPTVKIPIEEERFRAERLMEKAKRLCLVSRALAVEQKFEPRVQALSAKVEMAEPLMAR